jgi:hypothetical protein
MLFIWAGFINQGFFDNSVSHQLGMNLEFLLGVIELAGWICRVIIFRGHALFRNQHMHLWGNR